MHTIGRFLQSRGRTIAIGVAVIVAIGFAAISIHSTFGPSEAAALSNTRPFVCSETLRGFDLDLKAGMAVPVVSPFSGRATGYPAERCYWSTDGQIVDRPTYVLMQQDGPTFCPDCGRVVRAFNPRPAPGDVPPPMRDAFLAQRAGPSPGTPREAR